MRTFLATLVERLHRGSQRNPPKPQPGSVQSVLVVLSVGAISLIHSGCGMELSSAATSFGETNDLESRPGSAIIESDSPAMRALKSAGGVVLRLPFPMSAEAFTEGRFVEAKKVDLTGVIVDPEILGQVNAIAGISELVLNGPDVDDEFLQGLTACETLSDLDLSGSNVTDAGLAYLASGAFPALRILKLNETAVTGAGLAPLTQLQTLSLADTNINDGDLERLVNLKDLQFLNVVGTLITTEGLEAFRNAPGRERLLVLGVPRAAQASASDDVGRLPGKALSSHGS